MQIQRNKIPFSKLSIRRYPLKSLVSQSKKAVRGIDTETLDGYVRLIADDTGRYTDVEDIDTLLEWLTYKPYRSTTNFFYNVQFDFDSIVKYLDADLLHDLVYNLSVVYGDHKIKYIPKKGFTITKSGHTYQFYDLAQFYETSLEKAGLDYTGMQKNEQELDRVMIGLSPEYWEDWYEEIRAYCIQDCRITAALGELLQDEVLKTTEIVPKKWTSKATLAKQYFRRTCQIPDIMKIPRAVLEFCFNAYHGGRFEVLERGACGHCTTIDINSAYPYEISRLIDVTKGVWKRVYELSDIAYYGFYLAKVNVKYSDIGPLAFNLYNTVVYPVGEWVAYFTKEELEAVAQHGRYQVIQGFEFYPDEIVYPFKDAVQTMYDRKATVPKKSYQYKLYKKILNSGYGSFYEKYKLKNGRWQTGLMFNPIYACLITAFVRLEMYNTMMKYKDQAISAATDGIILKGDIQYDPSNVLGEWSYDGAGDCFILRSGIYSIGDEMKQRGVIQQKFYETPYGDYVNLFDYIRDKPYLKKYPVLNHRPVHLSEAIKHHKVHTKEDINVFSDHTIAFDLNTDVKRIFSMSDITGGELLNNNITSMPLYLDDVVKPGRL